MRLIAVAAVNTNTNMQELLDCVQFVCVCVGKFSAIICTHTLKQNLTNLHTQCVVRVIAKKTAAHCLRTSDDGDDDDADVQLLLDAHKTSLKRIVRTI